ncbi:hypothetical protein ACFL6C_03480 [Myxococcota bacterium]
MLESIAKPVTTRVFDSLRAGRVVGTLAEGEDLAAIERTLVLAPDLALRGEAELLTHADLDLDATPELRHRQRRDKLDSLTTGSLKRYVLRVDTARGPRIIKVAEIHSFGNAILGIVGSSVPRREHHFHLKAEQLGLAATRTLGFLEWRAGPRLSRACQVQTLLPDDVESLATFLRRQMAEHGDAALDSLGRALANTHAVPFFHADLKGFHAFVHNVSEQPQAPMTYTLRWIDLARVAFRLSQRQRIINLYQTLRFVVPTRATAQERFMTTYCRESGWFARDPGRGLRKVKRFLDYKYRTHPDA